MATLKTDIIINLEKVITQKMEDKHRKSFERQAQYVGNCVYQWAGCYSTDTRELFLMGIAAIEGLDYEGKELT